ncbi:MAG: hypothetical protein D3923_18735 [Candidatus Electrothrix sp. AR3]|nr:hypothetical protein [Candidatus Electrothrix sp. AR3]
MKSTKRLHRGSVALAVFFLTAFPLAAQANPKIGNFPYFITMNETHLYAGVLETSTAALGQYGNLPDLTNASNDQDVVELVSAETVYIVAHAVVCGTF